MNRRKYGAILAIGLLSATRAALAGWAPNSAWCAQNGAGNPDLFGWYDPSSPDTPHSLIGRQYSGVDDRSHVSLTFLEGGAVLWGSSLAGARHDQLTYTVDSAKILRIFEVGPEGRSQLTASYRLRSDWEALSKVGASSVLFLEGPAN